MKSIPIKILHIISQHPDATGSGIYIQAMIREAEATGYDNFLIAGRGFEYIDDPAVIDLEKSQFVRFKKGVLNYHIPGMSDVMPYRSSRFGDLTDTEIEKYEAAFAETVGWTVRQFQPTIIHSHHLWLVSSLVRRLFPDIPMVTSCHGSDLRQFLNCPHLQERVLSGCRRIDAILALSEGQQHEIKQLYDIPTERITVVGAGYNKALFHPQPKPPPNPVQLVYAGKLSNAKGVPWLLRALHLLPGQASFPNWQLHLVGSGSGEEESQCLELARSLAENVVIHGAIPQLQLAEIIRHSHILVLPSFYEGLPLVILEGLASGCRLVVNDLPGVRELLDHSDFNVISVIKPPRLHHTDQPYPSDEKTYIEHLKMAIEKQIVAAYHLPTIDLTPFIKLLDEYTWGGVFKKVNEVYQHSV